MVDTNLSILKLIFFQSSFMFMNLEKNCLDKKELNWFYQMFQILFYKNFNLLNIKEIDIEEKNLTKLSKKEIFELYKYMYDYIEKNKDNYTNLNI